MQRNHRNKRRSRKTRRGGRFVRAAILIVVSLGLIGLGALLFSDDLMEETTAVYPVEYRDWICRYAEEYGLQPAYVASIILAESSYNPQAVSSVNAQGLMQIMPDTGAWIAGKFDESYVEGCLFDPETNIRYGCWYLGYLLNRFDGDLVCSTAAYHSGQGTVSKWLEDANYSADGRTLTHIPGANAETYVHRVLEYYEKYDEIYAETMPA